MSIADFLDIMRPYWSGVALGVTWAGIGFVWWQRRRAWHSRQFLSRVNFSLNYAQDGTLAMRTLLELPATEVWLNEHGSGLVARACRRTSVEEPFIGFRQAKDQEFLNRAVLNSLSERYAIGYLAASLGVPVARDQYIFGITCEKYGEIRTLKIRVLLMREQTLIDLCGPARGIDSLALSNAVLKARTRTLEVMYRHYIADQTRPNRVLGHMELALPVAARTDKSECANR